MASENETHAEIVKDMRERCIDEKHSPSLWPYLDRLEAAHKREIAELRECLRLSSNAMETVVQWLGGYPEWQECLRNGVAINRRLLKGAK